MRSERRVVRAFWQCQSSVRHAASVAICLAAALLILPGATEAQQRPRQPAAPAQPAQPAPPPEAPPPPYEPQMLRLAEIMGAMSFLESLCQISDGQRWHDRMQALLESEEPGPARRERLAGAFNRGFAGFHDTYRACTASARQAMDQYNREGAALAAEIAGRFGG